ncbi:MAG: GDP-mannose-dependent alpha-(1-6)-phosphatidylinositol monomannoside mannosyltransferase [Alphaproteobacteria bacterium MarineAlpha5_Bin9]|nr:MAG: GDP-mannose-dependent alpha-(1-6)-phosphatidylinositol monomannoside mannosyltransferase [Alphaproteobacteria bacterium MarineAlpha5_Bin9]|tara:strand:+ start:297 stop:1403 length:1107 start_codon:yes stop_codon:yes gene_type:complete
MYLILTQCFPSRIGGIENLVGNLSITLGDKEGQKVIVLADRQHFLFDAIFDQENNKKIYIKRYGGIKFFRKRRKIDDLKFFIKSNEIKAIITDTWKSLELCIDEIHKNNIPTFCLAHGNELLTKDDEKQKKISYIFNKVSSIIANSNYTANLVKKFSGNNKKIKVIYPGATDLRKITTTKEIKIKGNPIIFTLARLEKRKGHLEVLKAINKLRIIYPEIKYIIAGEGKEKKNLQNYVKKNQIDKNVDFVGAINDFTKKSIFSITNLLVMTTLDETKNQSIEGFGIVFIEAAFFGIPSITSNVGGTSEAVVHNETGIVLHNQDKLYENILELFENKKKLNFLGNNAKIRAEKYFKWEIVIKKYLSEFKS